MNKKSFGMGCRAQISMEFMVTVILMLFVFGFGLFIFEQRALLNNESAQKWTAQDLAFRVARNIDSAYFLDGNAEIIDYIYWKESDGNIWAGTRVVTVEWVGGGFLTVPLVAPSVTWNVSELDGALIFRNVDGNVVVEYS